MSYSDGYRGVQKEMGQNQTATAAAIIVVLAIAYLIGISFVFKGSVHF
jgi:hypothetical protein